MMGFEGSYPKIPPWDEILPSYVGITMTLQWTIIRITIKQPV